MGTALLLDPRGETGSEGDRRRRRGKRVHRETALRRLGTLLLGIDLPPAVRPPIEVSTPIGS